MDQTCVEDDIMGFKPMLKFIKEFLGFGCPPFLAEDGNGSRECNPIGDAAIVFHSAEGVDGFGREASTDISAYEN